MSDLNENFAGHDPHEDPVAGVTWTVGIIGLALFVVCVVGVTALLYAVSGRVFEEQAVDPLVNSVPPELAALREGQDARLAGPPRYELRVENPEGERSIVIPLERAMRLVVEEQGRSPQAAAVRQE